jgi:hypothetical protein
MQSIPLWKEPIRDGRLELSEIDEQVYHAARIVRTDRAGCLDQPMEFGECAAGLFVGSVDDHSVRRFNRSARNQGATKAP